MPQTRRSAGPCFICLNADNGNGRSTVLYWFRLMYEKLRCLYFNGSISKKSSCEDIKGSLVIKGMIKLGRLFFSHAVFIHSELFYA